MRAVLQRVAEAAVEVAGERVSAIGPGILVLLGVQQGDTESDAGWMAEKLVHLRIFEDAEGKLNRSVFETGREALLVSQFTLLGDARKGRRPGFSEAAPPETSRQLYERVCRLVEENGVQVARGVFGAEMRVSLVNDGPVTLLLDSRKTF